MSITVELAPEVEARLWARACAQGVSLATYLQTVIEQIAALESSEVGSLEEFEAGMDALAEGSEQIPVLPPAAYSRESIYGVEA
jgi:hypothetical protein